MRPNLDGLYSAAAGSSPQDRKVKGRVGQCFPHSTHLASTALDPLKERRDAAEDPHILATRYFYYLPLGTQFELLLITTVAIKLFKHFWYQILTRTERMVFRSASDPTRIFQIDQRPGALHLCLGHPQFHLKDPRVFWAVPINTSVSHPSKRGGVQSADYVLRWTVSAPGRPPAPTLSRSS